MNISEVTVSFKPRIRADERTIVKSSKDAFRAFLFKWDKGLIAYQEEFKVMLLNSANQVIGILDLAKGAMDSVQVDAKIIFSTALKASARKIILAHNHPSENLIPSIADKKLTSKIIEAGKLLDIEVCDHLIISANKYYSFGIKMNCWGEY
ncbi:JAB domain-containing protein [Sphingobacterium sp. SRCM116780]|uniref:JAB domain-containing protein n=1 Tax=Sphingobacterium sp. SRCM116780 TaxID=2907623 RepID=UPI001F1BFF70|nr:JAB domain-containing protein [Sphingobacterium sp. SRCM116780]UIR57463.1 JAB domain-containing protein [Sphingobacterium sp. SRCM116780]